MQPVERVAKVGRASIIVWSKRYAELHSRRPRAAAVPTFPFHGGPRVCVNNHLALPEMQLCLVAVWRRVELVADGALVLLTRLPMRVAKR